MAFLELRDVSVSFSGFLAVDQVSLSVEKGETRVVIGPNGAGKTTIIDMITGKTAPTSGKVFLGGADITGCSPHEIAGKYKVGRKFQGPNLFDFLSVYENVEVALAGHSSVLKTFLYRKNKSIADEIKTILEQINLYGKRDVISTSLSHGERQWLEMGMVIAQKPQLITLDEPTAGMTADETYKTGEMIKTMMKDKTVIVVEHDIDFVEQIAETVTVLHQGKVLAEGTFAEVKRNPKVVQVYLKDDDEEVA
ncbi:MAG: urea transporter, ATP-binding protein UrtD [Firmicutes bacterium]|nr:urea transporter, ATP-binding protein UrtD [Bacillota bacterium]